MIDMDTREQVELEEQMLLEQSMARHPAGKAQRLRACPTCGHNVSGSLDVEQVDLGLSLTG